MSEQKETLDYILPVVEDVFGILQEGEDFRIVPHGKAYVILPEGVDTMGFEFGETREEILRTEQIPLKPELALAREIVRKKMEKATTLFGIKTEGGTYDGWGNHRGEYDTHKGKLVDVEKLEDSHE